jgi:hypothetical protein
MLIRPAIGDTDPIRYRRPNPDGQFSGNILDEAMRPYRRPSETPVLLQMAEYLRAKCGHAWVTDTRKDQGACDAAPFNKAQRRSMFCCESFVCRAPADKMTVKTRLTAYSAG